MPPLNKIRKLYQTFDEIEAQIAVGALDYWVVTDLVKSQRIDLKLLRKLYENRLKWFKAGELELYLLDNKKLPKDIVMEIWDLIQNFVLMVLKNGAHINRFDLLRKILKHPNFKDPKILNDLVERECSEELIESWGEFLIYSPHLTDAQYKRLVLEGRWYTTKTAVSMKRTSFELLKLILKRCDESTKQSLVRQTRQKVLNRLWKMKKLKVVD